jgi:hypothetical protein
MAESKFKVFNGKFVCHTCNDEVTSLRLWLESAEVTWMCKQKHISKVAFIKKKRDYERENGK